MALRGYAAVAVQYPNHTTGNDSTLKLKARTVAASNNTHSAFSIMCSHSKIDCAQGIAIFGYSQGALIAVLSAEFNYQIAAAFLQEGARPTSSDFAICDD